MLIINSNKKIVNETKVVRAEEYASLIDAATIVEDAKKKAKKIIEQANIQANLVITEAQKAYEQEKNRGYAEGKLAGHQKNVDMMFDMMVKGIDYVANLESTLVHVVQQSLERILGETHEEERIVMIVRQALKTVKDSKSIKIRLHPEQVGILRIKIDELIKTRNDIQFIECSGDNQLQKDQCVLETEFGIIDASLDVQLKAILTALEKVIR